jgi:diaminopimelate decarboxylase
LAEEESARAATYREGRLHIEQIPARQLAEEFGTPLYVYSTAVLRRQYLSLESSLRGLAPSVLICYALKANANPTIGRLLAGWGAGADVVSGGELYLAGRMGFSPDKIVFAGVGKTRREMAEALAMGIRAFHVESEMEARALAEVAAELHTVAPLAVRVNPDVDAGTHRHITTGTKKNKFGLPPHSSLDIIRYAHNSPDLEPVGLHAHIGSQLLRVEPELESVKCLLALWDTLVAEGIGLRELDIGGGLGIQYRPDDEPEGPEALADGLRPLLAGHDLELVLEPGRFLVGPAGVLLTTVLYLKETDDGQSLAVVDAGMNDLVRPALYEAWHPVWPAAEAEADAGQPVDIVGPVCESADVLAQDRRLGALKPGDILVIGQAGAYGFSMASQYNGRPRPAEVLVDGNKATLIRKRESYEDL